MFGQENHAAKGYYSSPSYPSYRSYPSYSDIPRHDGETRGNTRE